VLQLRKDGVDVVLDEAVMQAEPAEHLAARVEKQRAVLGKRGFHRACRVTLHAQHQRGNRGGGSGERTVSRRSRRV
jgi:hypothetical protein